MGSVCVSTLVCSLFDSKDPDHLYFVHISLLLYSSSEQTEQTVGIPGKKLKEAHPEIKACSIITAWLETTGQSPECCTAELGENYLSEIFLNLIYVNMMRLLEQLKVARPGDPPSG